jgi:hypothetical protein
MIWLHNDQFGGDVSTSAIRTGVLTRPRPTRDIGAGADERQFAVPAATDLVLGLLAVIVASGHVAGPYQCRDPNRRRYSTLISAFRIIGIHLPSSCSRYFTKSPGGMVTASAPSLLNFSAISGSFKICAIVL